MSWMDKAQRRNSRIMALALSDFVKLGATVLLMAFLGSFYPYVVLAETNLQPVQISAQWGFINPAGEVVVTHQFERVGNFQNGLAAVRLNNQEGFIDQTGTIVIPPVYAWVADFVDNLARVNIGGTWNGARVIGGKWGFIDKTGKLIVEAQFEDAKDFAEGLAAVKLEGKWGYIDKSGKIVIKPRYTEAWKFSQSLALVRGSNYSYINPLGKVIIEPKKVSDWSDVPGHFSEDLARVKIRGKWGFIDRRGNIVIAAEYDSVSDFNDNIAVVQFDNQWGFINKNGSYIIQPQFAWVDRFYGDRAIVKVGDKYGFIDQNGKVVISAQYDEVTHFSEGLAAVKTIDGWGFIDTQGNLMIKPSASASLNFVGGFAGTRIGPGWGYVNDANQFIIAPKFEWASEFSEGMAFVKVDGLYGYINSDGNWIVLPRYIGFSNFTNGNALVSAEIWNPGSNFYIDLEGNVVKTFSDFIEENYRTVDHLLKEELVVMATDDLKVYQEPDQNSIELGSIPYGSHVQIIDYTFEPIELDGIKGHWVAIEYAGETAYIFDGLLSRYPALDFGSSYTHQIMESLQTNKEDIIWYSPDQQMRVIESSSGYLVALSSESQNGLIRWDAYIPGISLREAFLLVKSMATEKVISLNGQKIADGTLIKDIPYNEHNGKIIIEVKGVYGKSAVYTIIIEKEKLGYVHIYELYDANASSLINR